MMADSLDSTNRRILNLLQDGFPVCERPYAEAAAALGLGEKSLIDRLRRMLANGVLSRFGPLYHAERLGGGLTLAALAAPEAEYDRIADIVNEFPEVAHNYARDHALNMWFVIATETPQRIRQVLVEIERCTGCTVHDMPKIEEFFVGLRLEA